MSETECILRSEFSRLLNEVIGDEDIVKCRRAIYSCWLRGEYEDFEHYTIGSKADGLDLKDSDLDVMFVLKVHRVEDNTSGEHNTFNGHISAIYTPHSSSVHMQLKRIPTKVNHYYRYISKILNSVIYYKGCLLISSSQYVNQGILSHSNKNQHNVVGPSDSIVYEDTGPQDRVIAVKCNTFPVIAHEWIHRRRKYSWPSSELINAIQLSGCNYVPVGEHKSHYFDMEWRISFVLAECALVRSFSYVQFKIYGIMKLIKSYVLNKFKHPLTSDYLITSYHIKTIMFYLFENTPSNIFVDSNIILGVRLCLVYLMHCVKSNYLPHYFLPKINLLKKHTCVDNGIKNMITEVEYYIREKSLGLQLLELVKAHGEVSPKFEMLRNVSVNLLIAPLQPLYLIQSMNQDIETYSDCEYTIIYRCLSNKLYCTINNNERQFNANKSMYVNLRRLRHTCLLKTHLDVATGWLNVATYFYEIQQYYYTEQLCKHVIEAIPRAAVYIGKMNPKGNMYASMYLAGNIFRNFHEEVKQLTVSPFYIYKKGVYPIEMNIEIVNARVNYIEFPTMPFAYFVLFLCAYHCNDIRGQLEALEHLEYLVYDKLHGIMHIDCRTFTILNMVGMCYEMLCNKQRAAYYYREAIHITDTLGLPNPHQEAASIRLQLMGMSEL